MEVPGIETQASKLKGEVAQPELCRDDRMEVRRLQALVSILQFEADDLQSFLDYALSEAIALTASKIGYINIYDADRRVSILNTWSREALKECALTDPQTCYALERTGIWGEDVRRRRAIVVNDYSRRIR